MSETGEKKRIVVNGFSFENEAEAQQAAKEAEGVKYIREQADMDDPEVVCQIYNKMIQQDLFETAVGFSYLKTLQEYLMTVPYLREEDILPIPVQHPALEANIRRSVRSIAKDNGNEKKGPGTKERERAAEGRYKQKFQIMGAICAVLTVCIIGMFIISATSNNMTILNYENELINKYEAWEDELNEREAILKEKEQAYGISEEV